MNNCLELSTFAEIVNLEDMTEHARNHRITFMLNDDEYKVISKYLDKYNISNRSNWCRETIIMHVLKVLDKDYPTLFNENEMRR